jgi:hypothetical protein
MYTLVLITTLSLPVTAERCNSMGQLSVQALAVALKENPELVTMQRSYECKLIPLPPRRPKH